MQNNKLFPFFLLHLFFTLSNSFPHLLDFYSCRTRIYIKLKIMFQIIVCCCFYCTYGNTCECDLYPWYDEDNGCNYTEHNLTYYRIIRSLLPSRVIISTLGRWLQSINLNYAHKSLLFLVLILSYFWLLGDLIRAEIFLPVVIISFDLIFPRKGFKSKQIV